MLLDYRIWTQRLLQSDMRFRFVDVNDHMSNFASYCNSSASIAFLRTFILTSGKISSPLSMANSWSLRPLRQCRGASILLVNFRVLQSHWSVIRLFVFAKTRFSMAKIIHTKLNPLPLTFHLWPLTCHKQTHTQTHFFSYDHPHSRGTNSLSKYAWPTIVQ